MATFLEALGLALLSAIALGHVLLLGRAVYLQRITPHLSEVSNSMNGPLVSIVIPARNEEANIARCLGSLSAQTYRPFEILMVDDASTDRTATVAEELRLPDVRVIRNSDPPAEWVGKNWACAQGAAHARGTWILFSDADTRFAPTTLASALTYAEREHIEVLSIIPRVETRGFWAGVVVPLLTLIILVLFPIAQANDPRSPTAYVFGSFFLVRRDDYERIGGHGAIRHAIVEDRAFGELAKRSGLHLRILDGSRFFQSRWSSGFRDVWHGIERVVSSSTRGTVWPGMGFAALTATMSAAPALVLALLFVYPSLVDAALQAGLQGLAAAATVLGLINHGIGARAAGVPLAYALAAPLAGLFFAAATISTVYQLRRGRGLTWRGRAYHPYRS